MSGWVLCFGDELSSSTPASVSCPPTLLRITFPFFYICLHPPSIHSYLPHFSSSNCLNSTIFCLTSHLKPSFSPHSISMFQPHFNSLIFVSVLLKFHHLMPHFSSSTFILPYIQKGGGADLPPSSSIEEKNIFFSKLYIGNKVSEISKLGHKLNIFRRTYFKAHF